MTAPNRRIFRSKRFSKYSYVDVSFMSWKTGRKTNVMTTAISSTPLKMNMYCVPYT